jgi:hypothetical protein
MQLLMNPLISNKELALGLWAGHPISTKTMRRERQRWGLKPKDVDGNTPLFDPEDVEEAKKRRLEARLAQIS